jgi:hypothetical protein
MFITNEPDWIRKMAAGLFKWFRGTYEIRKRSMEVTIRKEKRALT